MKEAEVLAIFKDYGPWVLLLIYILIRSEKFAQIGKGFFDTVFPQWAARRKMEIERERHRETMQEKERLDVILLQKDMLLQFRQEVDDAKMERKQLTNTIVDFVGKYERSQANVVEVLRDVSSVIRALKERVDVVLRRDHEQRNRGATTESPGVAGPVRPSS